MESNKTKKTKQSKNVKRNKKRNAGLEKADALTAGDKFKDDSITVYDITPGENYKLLFTEYNW